VILDLLMPDISGLEILRQLRAQPETKSLPVLIYTSKRLTEAEKAQIEGWQARTIRKEDVSTRLSAQPFLDWLRAAGLNPETREAVAPKPPVDEPESEEPKVREPERKEPKVKEPSIGEDDNQEPSIDDPEDDDPEIKEPEVREQNV
jgi:CheY-like chemotaxis protein